MNQEKRLKANRRCYDCERRFFVDAEEAVAHRLKEGHEVGPTLGARMERFRDGLDETVESLSEKRNYEYGWKDGYLNEIRIYRKEGLGSPGRPREEVIMSVNLFHRNARWGLGAEINLYPGKYTEEEGKIVAENLSDYCEFRKHGEAAKFLPDS